MDFTRFFISNLSNTLDFLPLLIAALVTDLIIIIIFLSSKNKSKTLTQLYKKNGIFTAISDVITIVFIIMTADLLYPFIFSKFSALPFICLAIITQIIHDLIIVTSLNSIPRGKNDILDKFKDYTKDFGPVNYFTHSLMVISTIIIASLLSSLSNKTKLIFLSTLFPIFYIIYSWVHEL